MGQGKLDITIIIIAGNESEMIVDCLKSAAFSKQIILVAANSTDNTVKNALSINPSIKIINTQDEYGRNYAKWHNIGLKAATTDWIFYLDADERITTELKEELYTITKNSDKSYYAIPRNNYYLGKRVRYGGSYPDYVKRLFLRSRLKEWTGILHEEPEVSGEMGYAKYPLLHYTHRNLYSMVQKSLIWTDMEAQALYKNNHPPVVWWRFIRMMLTKFMQRLLFQQMWRDGTVGWISAVYESFDTFIIYARLWELQQTHE